MGRGPQAYAHGTGPVSIRLWDRSHEHMLMGMPHEHILTSLAREHVLIGLAHEFSPHLYGFVLVHQPDKMFFPKLQLAAHAGRQQSHPN